MSNCKLLALGALALMAVACGGPKAKISATVDGAPETKLVLKDVFDVIDTVKTDKDGHFNYTLKFAKGAPEFVYVWRGETKIASLLLSEGEKAVVNADTLGNYSVAGSEESVKLMDVEQRFSDFVKNMLNAESQAEMSRLYITYYRNCVRYVMDNNKSLTVVPVFFQKMNELSPIFSQSTDALHFRRACDSLRVAFPTSRYVDALEKETVRRENQLKMTSMINDADQLGYPDLSLPGVDGRKHTISELKSKVVLVHFWSAEDATHKMFNNDVLKPLYKDFHAKGFDIYSVCLSVDKNQWASAVKNQGLEWMNVCDGLGAASPAASLYNVVSIPTSVLIADGNIASSISGEAGLRKELARLLK